MPPKKMNVSGATFRWRVDAEWNFFCMAPKKKSGGTKTKNMGQATAVKHTGKAIVDGQTDVQVILVSTDTMEDFAPPYAIQPHLLEASALSLSRVSHDEKRADIQSRSSKCCFYFHFFVFCVQSKLLCVR